MKNSRKAMIILFSVILVIFAVIVFYQQHQLRSITETAQSLQMENEELLIHLETEEQEIALQEKTAEIVDQYHLPQPAFLQKDWVKVILEMDDQELIIDSPLLLDAFRGQFMGIIQTVNPYPSGFPISFKFKIHTQDELNTFYALENGFFMNETMDKFYRSEKDIIQVAKALLTKPKGYPEETLMSKLFHSGMIKVETDEFYFTDKSRIQVIASAFIELEKEEIAQPTNLTDFTERLTFYYFGEKYYMTLYDEYVHISDEQGAIDLWYKVENEDLLTIHGTLSAG